MRAIVAGALAAFGFAVAAPAASATPGISHERSEAATSGARYWTAERLREAEPRPLRLATSAPAVQNMPTVSNRHAGARPPNVPGRFDASQRGVEAYGTYEVIDDRSYPNLITGKIFARDATGTYSCSGTVVNSQSNNILFTAAHCVRTPGIGWATKLIFIPAYRHGAAPFGRWNWKTMYLPRGWTSLKYDYAAVKLQRRNRNIEARIGGAGFAWNQGYDQDIRALGYPGNYFRGGRMMGCLSPVTFVDSSMGGPAPVGIDCLMGPGSSGGGWLIDNDEYLNSVMSYGYDQLPELGFGPYFTTRAIQLLRWAERD
jgi:V8-like Glu-specific endopeptidase